MDNIDGYAYIYLVIAIFSGLGTFIFYFGSLSGKRRLSVAASALGSTICGLIWPVVFVISAIYVLLDLPGHLVELYRHFSDKSDKIS